MVADWKGILDQLDGRTSEARLRPLFGPYPELERGARLNESSSSKPPKTAPGPQTAVGKIGLKKLKGLSKIAGKSPPG